VELNPLNPKPLDAGRGAPLRGADRALERLAGAAPVARPGARHAPLRAGLDRAPRRRVQPPRGGLLLLARAGGPPPPPTAAPRASWACASSSQAAPPSRWGLATTSTTPSATTRSARAPRWTTSSASAPPSTPSGAPMARTRSRASSASRASTPLSRRRASPHRPPPRCASRSHTTLSPSSSPPPPCTAKRPLADPARQHPRAFRAIHERRLLEQRAWISPAHDGAVLFKAEVACACQRGVQIAGVYTAPQARNLGLARRDLNALCHLLLQRYPRATLYVNDNNAPALRLYQRLGFTRLCDYATIFIR
jgi:GNAT superfamily N-acetyltransferase